MKVLLLLAGAFALLNGCASVRNGGAPEPSFDITADLKVLAEKFDSSIGMNAYYDTPAAERKDARNRFATGRLVQIDLRYLLFIKTLTADKQQLDSATDIASLTLNLAGTLVGGARAKTNLAATAAGLGGIKTTIDKDFYYEKSIEALVATMNAKRKDVLVGILTGLVAPVDQYPFERMLTDLQQYYLAGTLNGAIQFINVQAADNEVKSTKALNSLYRLAVPTADQVTDTLRLTDAIGAKDLTLAAANATLASLGTLAAGLPQTLDDPKTGARQLLKNKVREAARLPDDGARDTALKTLFDAFKSAGVIK